VPAEQVKDIMKKLARSEVLTAEENMLFTNVELGQLANLAKEPFLSKFVVAANSVIKVRFNYKVTSVFQTPATLVDF
jgi:hypothetical protein